MTRPRQLKLAVSLGVLGLLVCSPFILNWYYLRFVDPTGEDVNAMQWQESVPLASGETITVDRYVKFRQEGTLAMGLMAQEYMAASLAVISGPTDFISWSAPLLPILLDRDPQNGEWIVVAAADSSHFWVYNGQPCPEQWAFRLHNGTWYLQPIPESLIGRKPNLLLDLRVSDDKDFSSSEFASVAPGRKARQAETGERISPTMRFVGDSNEVTVACKAPGPPRFTGPFHAFEEPNLASFPRMP